MNLPPLLASPVSTLLFKWTCLLALGWAGQGILRHRHARWRLMFWRGILCLGLTLPFLHFIQFPGLEIPITIGSADNTEFLSAASSAPAVKSSPAGAAPVAQPARTTPATRPASNDANASPPAVPAKRISWEGVLIVIWAVGCGAGATSLALAKALPAARITGMDISPGLTAIATERAGDIPNLRFVTGPAEALLADHAPVDLFVSRHGVMFFPDPAAAFAALGAAAAPNGRIVFSCFRSAALNPWASEIGAEIGVPTPPSDTYIPGPFAFADPDFVRPLLEGAGWGDIDATPIDYSYRAGEGSNPVVDACDLFTQIGPTARAFNAAAPAARSDMLERIITVIERYHSGDTVDFPAAAWIWSARRSAEASA